MFDIRTVLVPVDFSPCSLTALQHAVALAAPRRGTVHLLHVVDPIASGLGDAAPIAPDVLERFQNRLDRLAESIQSRDVKTRARVAVGSVEGEILDALARHGADLIVMGTHGRSGWGLAQLGGTAERVVRRANCPVLTVKERRATRRMDELTTGLEERAVL